MQDWELNKIINHDERSHDNYLEYIIKNLKECIISLKNYGFQGFDGKFIEANNLLDERNLFFSHYSFSINKNCIIYSSSSNSKNNSLK